MNRNRLWALQARYAPYLFLAPFALLFCTFLLYPLARSAILSFHKSLGPREPAFVGWANYRFLLTDRLFLLAAANTIGFTIAFLLIQIPLSLGLALLVNSRRLRFRGFFRFAFFSTNMVGTVFAAALFSVLFAPRYGLINRAAGLLNHGLAQMNFLSNPNLALPATVIVAAWLSVGLGMIYFLAALQAVDRGLYEAAEVDGAGRWNRFWHITLPGIKPVFVFLVLVSTIGGFQLFELPYVLFSGPGPNYRALTIVMYLFITSFDNLGYAAAIGWLLVVLLSGLSFAQLRMSGAAREL